MDAFKLTRADSIRQDATNVKPVAELNVISAVVFVNPKAGNGRAVARIPKICEVFESQSVSAEFVTTADSNALESAARSAIAKGARALFAVGGDGTVQGLVNAAFGADVVVGILPAGGGNDFASALGIPIDALESARLLARGRVLHADVARARTADGRERLYLGGGGVGIDAEAAGHASGAFRWLPGRSRYIAAALRAFATFAPIGVRAEFPMNGLPPIQTRALLAAVLNTPIYGAGIRLAPDARLSDGLLDVVIAEDLSFFQMLGLLPRLILTGGLDTPRIKRVHTPFVRLATDRPCLFHGDGEILGPTPVEIEVIPKAIQVLAPTPH